jgi:hypothetical protein
VDDAGNCALKTVAANPACRIFVCEHGMIHINIGFASLRVAPEALRLIGEAIRDACGALGRAHDHTRCFH